ncbi:MAG: hypothetical protein EXR99_16645 [Gemmataceae bacterium]|nr:hypothetical protein [Gemmataceae bacterium]
MHALVLFLALSQGKVDPSDAFFASTKISRITIEVGPKELQQLRAADRTYVACTVRLDGGLVFNKVGIHLKGAAGSFRGIDDRPALSLNFDKFQSGQNFFGLDKVHLNNSVQDENYLHELICREASRAARVPTGRSTHALVTLNNRDLGLYVLVEGLDRAFLKRNFKNSTGNLFDGGFCAELDQPKKLLTGPKGQKDEQADVKNLMAAAREPDLLKRLERLETLLDIDRFWDFTAVEQILCHWDGYIRNRNNYRFYFDPSNKNRAVFLTWGMDQMLGDPNFDLRGMAGFLATQLMQCPGQYFRYNEALRRAYVNIRPLNLEARVDEVAAKLKPVRDVTGGANDLKNRLRERYKVLDRLIGELPPGPPVFDASQSAQLDEFRPGMESGPSLILKAACQDRTCYYIRSSQEAAATWRNTVSLDRGKYKVEVLARAENVQGGVSLRLSTGQKSRALTNTTGWEKLEVEFQVNAPQEVALFLELRGRQGESFFADDSIRLIRLP